MASKAVHYFDKSFAMTSKLSVALAFTKKDQPSIEKFRPWSRHAKSKVQPDITSGGESTNDASNENKTETAASTEDKGNNSSRQKIEYLSSISLKTRSKFWTNDDTDWIETNNNPTENEDDNTATSSSDSDEYDNTIQTPSHKLFQTINDDKIPSEQSPKVISSDLDFLRSKIVNNFDDQEVDDNEIEDEDTNEDDSSSSIPSSNSNDDENIDDNSNDASVLNSKHENDDAEKTNTKPTTSQGPQELSSTRLFVRNLPFSADEDDLKKAFEPYGQILECMIPLDNTNRNFGYGFIEFDDPENALKALRDMDGSDFQGRLLHVLPARIRETQSTAMVGMDGGKPGSSTFKSEQEKARQSNAINNPLGWSTSFIRGDTVVDNLAERLGVQKGDILAVKDGMSAGDAAVRLALGETTILEENRKFFESHGVDSNLIQSKRMSPESNVSTESIRRSSTMIIVKNLPYDTSLEEITKTFHQPVGASPKQVLMPPSKTFALVQYEQSYIAKRAFKALAYKRFKSVPLYLEWAPLLPNVVTKSPTTQQSHNPEPVSEELPISSSTHSKQVEIDEDTNIGASNTLFVKNLNFATTEADLRELFEGVDGKVRAVRIPMKVLATKKPTKTTNSSQENTQSTQYLSMGYGFVEFSSSEAALKAMKKLQSHMFQGHILQIKVSSSADSGTAIDQKFNKSSNNQGKHKKLMIRNVPFEASRGELLQLFGSFGQLKNVRLPKKFDGGHRGFAFVEFLSSDEARVAMESLKNTHLYGRHLVVEYADDKEDLDTLREKTQQQQHAIQIVAKEEASRKRKKDLKNSNKT